MIGAGRAATALASGLGDAGWRIVAVAGRRGAQARRLARRCGAGTTATSVAGRACLGADVVLLAVPDREIVPLARALAKNLARPWTGPHRSGPDGAGRARARPARIVFLHTSGASGADILLPLKRQGYSTGSLHPLLSFPGSTAPSPDMKGATFAIDGDRRARAIAARLARSVGGRPLRVPPSKRAQYHLAACLASNYVVTLAAEAVALLARAGVPSREALGVLLPLLRSTLANLESAGLPDALTGPVARGDAVTVAKHAVVLRRSPAGVAALHGALVRRTVRLAASHGLLAPAAVRRIERALRPS